MHLQWHNLHLLHYLNLLNHLTNNNPLSNHHFHNIHLHHHNQHIIQLHSLSTFHPIKWIQTHHSNKLHKLTNQLHLCFNKVQINKYNNNNYNNKVYYLNRINIKIRNKANKHKINHNPSKELHFSNTFLNKLLINKEILQHCNHLRFLHTHLNYNKTMNKMNNAKILEINNNKWKMIKNLKLINNIKIKNYHLNNNRMKIIKLIKN